MKEKINKDDQEIEKALIETKKINTDKEEYKKMLAELYEKTQKINCKITVTSSKINQVSFIKIN